MIFILFSLFIMVPLFAMDAEFILKAKALELKKRKISGVQIHSDPEMEIAKDIKQIEPPIKKAAIQEGLIEIPLTCRKTIPYSQFLKKFILISSAPSQR
jgi:hypothetical protein